MKIKTTLLTLNPEEAQIGSDINAVEVALCQVSAQDWEHLQKKSHTIRQLYRTGHHVRYLRFLMCSRVQSSEYN